MHCPKCHRYFTPTEREAEAAVRGEPTPICPSCYVARAFRGLLYGVLLLIVLGGVCLMLTGCMRPGAWGNGPASDGEQQELERIRRERGASKVSQREAAEKLRRLNPMGGG